jgi:3-oxoacyl-[acyl-carrier protein] reductase
MKTLFLTGAGGDIGAAIKTIFENNAYSVTAPNRKELDLQDIASIKSYFSTSKIEADVIIHCAGVNDPKPIGELAYEDIEKTAKINYISFFEIVKELAPYMQTRKKGHILAVSSIYSEISRNGRLAYAASKHALNGVVKTLACELGKYNVLVNAISPGFVDTKMTSKNNSPEKIASLAKNIPLQRLALPQEIATAAFYLCSENNSYISGQNIIVDGGFIAQGGQNQ